MNIRIDAGACVGCSTCAEICPEIIIMDGDLACVKTTVVPEELEEACREAAESCPVEAVILED